MCPNHHVCFDEHYFIIRFHPNVSLIFLYSELSVHQKQIQKFVFVNYSGAKGLQELHGKAVALDISDRDAPFPSIFIMHEFRVRGFQPFSPVAPDIPNDITWQDWVLSGGVLKSDGTGLFQRDRLASGTNTTLQPLAQIQPQTAAVGGTHPLPALGENVITEILAATRASLSWKACQMEGTSLTGTAEENRQKYNNNIGTAEG